MNKKKLDFEESVLIEAFAIEIERITNFLSSVLKKTKYIDFLAVPFLAFSTLYKSKIIAPKNDLFIFMNVHES